MFDFKNTLEFQKRSVYLVNLFFVLIVIFTLLYSTSLKYFFYFNITFTFVVSYFYFKHSKKLAKHFILTNMFIFFYFLYPNVAWLFTELFKSSSYIFIVFYNVLISYIFLSISGFHKTYLGNLKKFNKKILLSVILLGFVFGLFFTIVKEPIPAIFAQALSSDSTNVLILLITTSFLVALSEQMIFSGFLFNVYSKLTSKKDAIYQTATIFVLFHLLRFEILVKHYFVNFNDLYLLYIIAYYILLFLFMVAALRLYSFSSRKYSGNFVYPLALHFATDFGLFFFYIFNI